MRRRSLGLDDLPLALAISSALAVAVLCHGMRSRGQLPAAVHRHGVVDLLGDPPGLGIPACLEEVPGVLDSVGDGGTHRSLQPPPPDQHLAPQEDQHAPIFPLDGLGARKRPRQRPQERTSRVPGYPRYPADAVHVCGAPSGPPGVRLRDDALHSASSGGSVGLVVTLCTTMNPRSPRIPSLSGLGASDKIHRVYSTWCRMLLGPAPVGARRGNPRTRRVAPRGRAAWRSRWDTLALRSSSSASPAV